MNGMPRVLNGRGNEETTFLPQVTRRIYPALVFLLLGLLPLPPAWAGDILVYQGPLRLEALGGGLDKHQTYQSMVVIDPHAGEVGKISYYSGAGGLKLFVREDFLGFCTNSPTLPQSTTNLVLACLGTDTNTNSQVTATATFLSGSDYKLKVGHSGNTDRLGWYPKVLNWNSRSVGPDSTGVPTDWQETGVVRYAENITVTNNDGWATVTNQTQVQWVLSNLAGGLRSKGYQEVVPK